MRTWRLAGGNNFDQKSLYDTTFNQFSNGYGTQLWSCSLMQADIASPSGRLSSGSVDFEFHFEKTLTKNLLVKFIFLLPKELHLPQCGATGVTKIDSWSYA